MSAPAGGTRISPAVRERTTARASMAPVATRSRFMNPPSQHSHSTENQILAGLDKTDYHHLFPLLERVSLSLGEIVYEAGSVINYVYFPETAVFSMLATMEDGRTVEV